MLFLTTILQLQKRYKYKTLIKLMLIKIQLHLFLRLLNITHIMDANRYQSYLEVYIKYLQ